MLTTTDWIQEAKDYAGFLNLEEEDSYSGNDPERARQWCEETLDHMVCLNGNGDLYETEIALAKLLNYDLEG